MFKESGIKIYHLDELRLVLEQWQKLNDDPSWFEYDDAPWWYNERASLSIFAGAVWKTNGSVFEEFSVIKDDLSKRSYNGRCDIEFNIGHSEFMGEAKQCWIDLSRSSQENLKEIESSIKSALDDVRQVPLWKKHSKVGIVFVVPSISVREKKNINLHLTTFVEQINKIENVTVAWVFPNSARFLEPPQDNPATGNFFPGIAIIIAEVLPYQ